MTEPRPGRHDAGDRPDHLSEHFLEDGVAPAVIGGGPPESPFEVYPDPDPEPRDQYRPQSTPRLQEPPTSPIPVIQPEPERQKRKSWVARMFGG